MQEFTSRYSELTFFVKGKPQSFKGGRFVTDCKDCIAVLETLGSDVTRTSEVEEAKAEEKPKAARKPARKTSDK